MATQEKWIEKTFSFNKTMDDFNTLALSLHQNPIYIQQLTAELNNDQLNRSLDSKWSIKEHIGHLSDLEILHSKRLDEFIAGEKLLSPADMSNKRTNEADYNKLSLEDLNTQFLTCRKEFLVKLKTVPSEALMRKAFHGRLNNDMKLLDMLYFMNEHDLHHIESIKNLIQ